ncbi:sulfite exporter TauE/SafE family protein [Labedaea rhizosphaerae]|uniref:Probable membrane transporter protein n=1 Tax=Labedaea rhizosphaerae TaxID=598644 RepID=A0A4R6SIM9_LABRH|nr:sulfite exporter TauE/SafE family protein [Labedaea rhizosphaerae]TDQ01460.1 hypothetical protein EV186_1021329 [Labedaea rhizosphaerae]
MSPELLVTLLLASILAFGLAWLSSVGGMGGTVVMMVVFTALFGLQVAVPLLTLTQLASNGGRAWFNRAEVQWRIIRWHALGAIPFALGGGLLFAYAPVELLKRLLGASLMATVVWRRLRPSVAKPGERTFIAIGGAAGLSSSLLGAAGPLTAPFFLAYSLSGGAYVGTEAAASLVIHLTKITAYATGSLVSPQVLLLGAALAPAVTAGTWAGKKTLQHMSKRLFVAVTEVGILIAGVLLVVGI